MMTQFNVPGDMATGFSTLATPSANVQRSAGVQLCKEGFGIPVSGCPIMTDTYASDGRSVAEKALGGLMSIMAGMDIAYGVGRLGGASLASPAQLVIDNQLIALLKEYVGGVRVDDDYLAVDEIVEAGIGGSFVHSKHTLRHCRDYVEPSLFRFQLQQTWEAEGEKDLYERAVDEYRRLKTQIKPVDIAGRRAARHGRRRRPRRQGPLPVSIGHSEPCVRDLASRDNQTFRVFGTLVTAGRQASGPPQADRSLGGTVSINDIRQAVLSGDEQGAAELVARRARRRQHGAGDHGFRADQRHGRGRRQDGHRRALHPRGAGRGRRHEGRPWTCITPHLVGAAAGARGTVVIGAVEGDVHDIGKSLVALMLDGAGFEVHDLGVGRGARGLCGYGTGARRRHRRHVVP